MKNHTRHLIYSIIFVTGLISCKSASDVKDQTTSEEKVNYLEEQQQSLSYFNIYRGNSHSHTIFTWTHGAHRIKGITDLTDPCEFHPDWIVPPGMDYRDYNTISLDPEDYTNRQGLPDNHFERAMNIGYDFYVISDHSQEPTLQPVSIDNPVWQIMQKTADKYNDYPDFVALNGFEYSRNTPDDGGRGHINVIHSSEYVNADHGQRGPAPPWPEANWSIPEFYNWLKSAETHGDKGFVVAGFNHPGPDQYNHWDHIDSVIVKLVSTFEIHTRYGPIRWDAYIRALNKGWKVSPIGVLDNHMFLNEAENKLPPPTFVLAPELTREAITRAMRQRRTFASWVEGVELRYSVNGFIMGSTLDNPDTFNFHVEVNTRNSRQEMIRCIQILRDHSGGEDDVEVAAEILLEGNKNEIVWNPVIEDSGARYFLLRIFHNRDMTYDGNLKFHGSTVSAPVWTGR